MATGIAIDSTIAFALAEAADDIEPAAAQALQALWDNDFLPIALGSTVMLLATGLSIVRHGALPKWLGWIAIVLGVDQRDPGRVRRLPRARRLDPDRQRDAVDAGARGADAPARRPDLADGLASP